MDTCFEALEELWVGANRIESLGALVAALAPGGRAGFDTSRRVQPPALPTLRVAQLAPNAACGAHARARDVLLALALAHAPLEWLNGTRVTAAEARIETRPAREPPESHAPRASRPRACPPQRDEAERFAASTDGRVALHQLRATVIQASVPATRAKPTLPLAATQRNGASMTATTSTGRASSAPAPPGVSSDAGSTVRTNEDVVSDGDIDARAARTARRADALPTARQRRARAGVPPLAPAASGNARAPEALVSISARAPGPTSSVAGRDCAGLSIGDAVAGLSTGTIFGAQPAKPTAKSRTKLTARGKSVPSGAVAQSAAAPVTAAAPAAAAAAAAGEATDGEPETAFETVLTHYPKPRIASAGGAETPLAICAPGGRDGAVTVKWPKGTVAVSSDGGCLRAFYEDGTLAAMFDAAGNGSVNAPAMRGAGGGGATLLCASAERGGAGFTVGSDGAPDREWGGVGYGGTEYFELALSEQLGVGYDGSKPVSARAMLYFCHRGVRCAVPQTGGVRMLPVEGDLFGRTDSAAAIANQQRRKTAAAAHEKRPKQTHAEMREAIRNATSDLGAG